jgi:hypothetical protein
MKKKLFNIKCAECRKIFGTPSEDERFCPECKRIKIKAEPKPRLKPDKSIYAVTRELEKHNKKHGTMLSYGQYIALVDK